MTRDLPVTPAGYEAEGVVSPKLPEPGRPLRAEDVGSLVKGDLVAPIDDLTDYGGDVQKAGVPVSVQSVSGDFIRTSDPDKGHRYNVFQFVSRPDRLVSAEPDRAEGVEKVELDRSQDWTVERAHKYLSNHIVGTSLFPSVTVPTQALRVVLKALSPTPAVEGEGLRSLLEEAHDLLLERRHGNPARSAGHNARLTIEEALKLLQSQEQAGQHPRPEAGSSGQAARVLASQERLR